MSQKRRFAMLLALGLLGCASREHATQKGLETTADSGVAAACRTDDDCVLTLLAEDACCERCLPRAISRGEERAQAARRAGCQQKGLACPDLSCAPPKRPVTAACVAGACIARPASSL